MHLEFLLDAYGIFTPPEVFIQLGGRITIKDMWLNKQLKEFHDSQFIFFSSLKRVSQAGGGGAHL